MSICQNRLYFRAWAEERQFFSLEDVIAEAQRLGYARTDCGRSLMGANDVRVRVDEEHFVPESEVSFDVVDIDAELECIVGKQAIPYAALNKSDYMRLPPVPGWEWNPYLLTSFCWRFSRIFTLLCFHTYPHPRFGGALVRKSIGYRDEQQGYERMLEDVVRDAGLPPDGDIIDQWLLDHKWIRRRSGCGARIAARLRLCGCAGVCE